MRSFRLGWVAFGVIAFLLMITVILAPSYFKTKTVTTTVTHKERICDGNGQNVDCKYIIFTEDGEYEITDAIFGTVRFDSASVYGQVKVDCTYEIDYYGWRLPLFSTFPNVKNIEWVSCD